MKQEENGDEGKKEKRKNDKSTWQFVEYKETKKWSAEPAVKLQKLSSGLQIPTFNFKVIKPNKTSNTKHYTASPKISTRKRSLSGASGATSTSTSIQLPKSKSSDFIAKGSTEQVSVVPEILCLPTPTATKVVPVPPVQCVTYEDNEWFYPAEDTMLFGNEINAAEVASRASLESIDENEENIFTLWLNNSFNTKA